MLPLDSYRVLDLSLRAPGPFCTWLLGDMGADVIRIEEPASRLRAERAPDDVDPLVAERRAAHDVLGRNKRSIALNLKTAEGQEVFYKLCPSTDVVVEGFRPGVVARLGVDYDTVRQINPRIVYCSLSGYGQTGPYRQLPGHDINYIALGGALGIIGPSGGPPAPPSNLVGDFAAGGQQAAIGILMALLVRERTGRGQYLDVAMADGVVALMAMAYSDYFASGYVPEVGETRLTGRAPYYQAYRTLDGKYISVGCNESWFYENLCRLLELEEYIPHQSSVERWPEIRERFQQRFLTRTRDEWWRLFQERDICGAPVYSLEEARADPQLTERGAFLELSHPVLGVIPQVGIATRLSETPGAVRSFAPKVGEHTDALLAELGYGAARIQELRDMGAIK
ncbi:MAG: CoA transferase [Chloroflexi bacterium]|nr:CoA transferase [Chloroflexota bacterium]